MGDKLTDSHNALAGEIVTRIVKSTIDAGGNTSSVMVLLESVVTGVLMACGHIDKWSPVHRDQMLIALERGASLRMHEIDRRKH